MAIVGGGDAFSAKKDDILNYFYATMYIFFNCNVMQKDAQDLLFRRHLNIEPMFYVQFGSSI